MPVDGRDVLARGGAVGEAQVEDGHLPLLPRGVAHGRRPGDRRVGALRLEGSFNAETDDAVVVDNHDLSGRALHGASS